jgi:tRNA pseudouridine55 synthase|tara:strand:- start:324 stop:1232 length:909 start_codon:yes stop_codon:yes gene_type:complete
MTRKVNKINGILLLDKPSGMTSNMALQIIKKLFKAEKAGHTGSLDPIATGILPICFGQATKISKYLIESSKIYYVIAKLGIKTTTGDREGKVLKEELSYKLKNKKIENTLKLFIGRTEQLPPMFSAIKVDGTRLYKHARKGITIPRKKRHIVVHDISLKNYNGDFIELIVHCSKGTYIRTLVEDIASQLNTYAHVFELRRLSIDLLQCEKMISLKQLENAKKNHALDRYLLPLDIAIQSLPKICISKKYQSKFSQGQKVKVPPEDTIINKNIRVYNQKDQIVGLGCIESDGFLKPIRIFNLN